MHVGLFVCYVISLKEVTKNLEDCRFLSNGLATCVHTYLQLKIKIIPLHSYCILDKHGKQWSLDIATTDQVVTL